MTKVSLHRMVLLLIILLAIGFGCAPMNSSKPSGEVDLTAVEEITFQNVEQAYDNLLIVRELGYHAANLPDFRIADDFVEAHNEFLTAVSYVPSFLKEHPYEFPPLKIVPDSGTETFKIEKLAPFPDRPEDLLKASGYAEISREKTQKLKEEIFEERLKQLFSDLELIWKLEWQHSQEYIKSHNAFIEVRKHLPCITIPDSLIIPYSNMEVMLHSVTSQTIPAKEALESECGENQYREAIDPLKQSEEISQQVLNEYYQLIHEAQNLKEELENVIQNHPDNALGDPDFLDSLTQFLSVVEMLSKPIPDIRTPHKEESVDTFLSTLAEEAEKIFEGISAGGDNRVILTASKATQQALELDELGHGIFTYYLLEALQGMADTNRNGQIEVDEAFKYLSKRVSDKAKECDLDQTPVWYGLKVTNPVIIVPHGPARD